MPARLGLCDPAPPFGVQPDEYVTAPRYRPGATALRSRGVSVPGEVAVAGFDDIPLARHVGLTTVQVRIDELGERALARLLSSIGQADGGGDELHAPALVVRGTTDPGAQQ